MGIGILPRNFNETIGKLWELSSLMVFLSGDKNFNYKYYFKRIAVMKIFVTTDLYLLTDKSENCIETWNFLKRRLDDIELMQSTISPPIEILKSVGFGITNLSSLFKGMPQSQENSISELKEILKKYSETNKPNQEDIKNEEK